MSEIITDLQPPVEGEALEAFFVKENEKGIFIQFENPKVATDTFFVFGINGEKDERSRAFLGYWALQLNRAFALGGFFTQGKSAMPDQSFFDELTRLYELMIPPKT